VDDVIQTVRIARQFGAPLLSRGGGTSLSGQCCNTAIVMDWSKYANQNLEVNPDRKIARVRPGCVLDKLRKRAEKHGLTFGPDPATHTHCTLGGMLGNNSCGVHAQMAGCTSNNVESLEALLYDGTRFEAGWMTDSDMEERIRQGGRIGEILARLKHLRSRYEQEINKRFPRIPRRISGYALDQLFPNADGKFNLARALVGSEGTLVTILQATLDLVHNPPFQTLVVLGYPCVHQAGDHIGEILEFKPMGFEGSDSQLIENMKKKGLHTEYLNRLPEGGGWLLVQFPGESRQEADDCARELMEKLRRTEHPPSRAGVGRCGRSGPVPAVIFRGGEGADMSASVLKSQTMNDETVVVTGASAGLGRAIAYEFGRRGARVGLLARGREGLEAAKQEIESAGGKALVLPTEVADAEAVEAAATAVESQLGPVDIWINNAMVSVFAPVKEMRPEEYKRVTEVTYLGVVHGTLAALKRMLPRDRGAIVQIGSALAYRSIPLQSAYCGAKHAIAGFTDSLRCELLHDKSNIRLTMVQMPALNTPQFDWVKSRLRHKAQPVPPIFQPEVGAAAVYWAAHNDRREVFVGGSTVEAVIGQKIAPGMLDHYLGRIGYESQQTSEPEDPNRPDNLWQPVPGNHGAHGRFDAAARNRSYELWIDKYRSWLLAGLGVLLAGGLVLHHGTNRNP
jgi:NAD(P)-dependent dehydrogenase (short-subunit alcohol dehydrogenase family)